MTGGPCLCGDPLCRRCFPGEGPEIADTLPADLPDWWEDESQYRERVGSDEPGLACPEKE